MSKFKMIEKLGLEIIAPYRASGTEMVIAEDLEDLLQSAQVVYGAKGLPGDGMIWQGKQHNVDTHLALLIGITPIKKKTKAEAALEFIRELENLDHGYFRDKAKRILEMKDEV